MVNWEAIITMSVSIVGIMTVIFGFLSRYIANRVAGSINEFRIDVLSKMETRVTILETAMLALQAAVITLQDVRKR